MAFWLLLSISAISGRAITWPPALLTHASVSCSTRVLVEGTAPSTGFAMARTPAISRQIGAGILEQFRVTFDYPQRRLILERPTGSDQSRPPREP